MPIDPSISLQARAPDMGLITPGQAISLQNLVQEGLFRKQQMAEMQREQKNRVSLQQILTNQQYIDPATGMPNPAGIQAISGVDAQVGQKFAHDRLVTLKELENIKSQNIQEQVNLGLLDDRERKARKEVSDDLNTVWANTYKDMKKSGASDEKASQEAEKTFQTRLEDLDKGGTLHWKKEGELERIKNARRDIQSVEAKLPLAERKEEKAAERGEEDAFMKESNRLEYLKKIGKGQSEEAQRLRKHLEKMDAPPISLAGVGALQPDTLRLAAEQYLAGDKSAAMGYGRSAPMRAALQNEIAKVAKERGMSGADIAAMTAQYQGMQAGERTLGQRTANIEMAVTEAQQMAPLALTASRAVDRTKYPTLNKLLLAAERGTGDENVVRLGVATNSLINIYARAISPTGVPTVSDKDHARELLEAAWSKGQYAAGIDQLMKELQAARRSPGMVREEMRGAIAAPPGKAPQQTPYQGPKVTAPKPYDDPEKERRYQKWKQEHGYQ